MKMPEQIDERVKSRPEYPPVTLHTGAKQQVFITEVSDHPVLKQMYDDSVGIVGSERSLWLTSASDSLAADLAGPMDSLPLSTSIYLAGSEGFMWDAHNALLALDFAPDQIQMLPPVTLARRLFCTHCYTLMEGVQVSPHTCEGCGELLLVRDHFSRLHGAYVGVSINAEDRSEVIPPEAVA